MSKTQVLSEAKNILQIENRKKGPTRIRAVILSGPITPEQSLKHLTDSERDNLRKQVNQSLARERRRANARAWTYDLQRHVGLYLLSKSLS